MTKKQKTIMLAHLNLSAQLYCVNKRKAAASVPQHSVHAFLNSALGFPSIASCISQSKEQFGGKLVDEVSLRKDVLCRVLPAKGRSTFFILIHDNSMVFLNYLFVFVLSVQGFELERIEGDMCLSGREKPLCWLCLFLQS